MSVDEFIKNTSHSRKSEMLELRKIISKSVPALTEQIKWNAPSFCHAGDDRITFNLSKPDTILLIFHRGAKSKKLASKSPILKDNTEFLEWPAPDRGVMKFKSMNDVTSKRSALAQIVKDWITITSEHAA
ncbi:MAG TPA: DUF1801 domain-containing protein [Chryseosolibacter sp.]